MIEFKPEIGMRTYIDEQLEQFGFQFNNGLTTLEKLKTVLHYKERYQVLKEE
ncbi:hypothetical protein RMP33_003460 [Salmonella enterica]|nr:hypothetical protein [Salmonella enterica]